MPTAEGGLGFSLKWDMGWMHDTLRHLERDPVYRHYHYNELTFRALYAYSERYLLPLSHDEVVHGKGAFATKMPGDDWQRRANLRLLIGYQYLLPGKKLLFMGTELAPWHEWNHDSELEWALLDHPDHAGVASFVAAANACYRRLESLHGHDTDPEGFVWLVADAADAGVLAWLRWGRTGSVTLAAANFTPVARSWQLGVPALGHYDEILNSDLSKYGGSGVSNSSGVDAKPQPSNGQPAHVEITIPPLGVVALTLGGS
jgi:1,4-alpha-glucan branching enzyme